MDINDSTALQALIEEKLRDALGAPPSLHDDWNDTDLDSLEVILVCQQVEDALKLEIAMEEFNYEMTTANLITFIQSKQNVS